MYSTDNQLRDYKLTAEAKAYQKMSEENDMKQHANKIIQGIKKLDASDANRAVWELFQNAVDLSDHCEIQIRIAENEFFFTHNGKPFEPLTLDCLFKQLSSKTLTEKKIEYEDGDPVGQYGTGFITTHSLGKVVHIDGALKNGDWYVMLKNYVLDRSTENWQELARRIAELRRVVSQLLSSQTRFNPPYPDTTFRYEVTSDRNKENAEIAERSLQLILPYVMALNNKIQRVTFTDKHGGNLVYEHKGNHKDDGIAYAAISVNDEETKVYYLQSTDKKVTVILPLENRQMVEQLPSALPRLFVQYPLIGSEQLGINFIIHSRHFQPNESRDSIYLASDNESNAFEEQNNQRFIQVASALVFDFVKQYGEGLKNSFRLAEINFPTENKKPSLDSYFAALKKQWIDHFIDLPLVDTGMGKLTPMQTAFWSNELFADEEAFEATCYFAQKYYPASPVTSLVEDWTRIIDEWKITDTRTISTLDIAEQLKKDGSLAACGNVDLLHRFYKSLLVQEKSGLFTSLELLPNIKGDFRLLSGLNESVNLPAELIAVADALMPEVSQRHIHPNFRFDLKLTHYLRKNFETDINQVAQALDDKQGGSELTAEKLKALIDYCGIINTVDANNVPVQLVYLIAEYYDIPFSPLVMSPVKGDEIDLRTPQKRLLRLCLNDLAQESSDWVSAHMDWLKQLIHTGARHDTFKEIFGALPVYPNQLNEFCLQSKLSIDGGLPDEIVKLYDKILDGDVPLRGSLVNPLFNDFISNQAPYIPRMAAEEIEDVLSADHLYNDIGNNPFKNEIFHIIQHISDDCWGKWFYYLRDRRASVILDTFADETTKDSIFAIVTLDSNKLELLGKLALNANLEDILRLGQDAFQQQQQKDANFKHKYTIGTHIEGLLRAHIGDIIPDRIKVEVLNVQDGQDIVIMIDKEPVYFIEVKSRWNTDSSVRMSRNQTINAYAERSRYALCTVDMSQYQKEDRFAVEDIESIQPYIRFNDNIGDRVEQFQDVLKFPMTSDEFHLDGDFRTVVPQSYIEYGRRLDQFEEMLIAKIAALV